MPRYQGCYSNIIFRSDNAWFLDLLDVGAAFSNNHAGGGVGNNHLKSGPAKPGIPRSFNLKITTYFNPPGIWYDQMLRIRIRFMRIRIQGANRIRVYADPELSLSIKQFG